MERILGIDYGTRRIGIAIADTETRIPVPHNVVMGRNDPTRDAVTIIELAKREQAIFFVVGLPLNMTAGESDQTALTRRFAEELKRLSKLPVHLVDERLTSFAAQELLDEAGVKRKKQKRNIDAIAAQRILQSFLDQPLEPDPATG
jgi:putative Holliday junction resolvase